MKKNILEENMRRFGTKNLSEEIGSKPEHEIYTAIYEIISRRSQSQAPVDMVDDILERGEAKGYSDRVLIPLVKELNKIIDNLVELVDRDENF